MIDKVFPRKLNSSKDTRLHAKDEMLDAVNITIDENSGEIADGVKTASGNFGVVKPVKGNTAVTAGDTHTLATGSKVIGSCNDNRAGRIYYFVYSPTATESGVYYYETSTNSVKKLIASNLFNFRGNSFVDGNVVYVANADTTVGATDLKPVLFFTDNKTEPKKIDIQRVAEAGSGVTFLDFVSVCPRTPIDPPVWTFQSDTTRKVSNFRGERGFQFAYQNIYKSGDVSALSTYSTLAIPSAYLNQGTVSNPNFFAENVISIQITPDAFTTEVARVRVLARIGNSGSWFVVDERPLSDPSAVFQSDFYNDQIYSVLPEAETQKQFDSVPKKARTQDVTNNRLFYANYVEGFDVPEVSATIQHAFDVRPQDFISVNLELIPEIRQVNFAEDVVGTAEDVFDTSGEPVSFNSDECRNRVTVYRVDSSQLPNTVEANTQVIFNVSLSPENNFHFYESRDSMHSSAELRRMESVVAGTESHIMADNLQNSFITADFDASENVGMDPVGRSFFNGQKPDGFQTPFDNRPREGITTSPFGLVSGSDSAFPRWATLSPQDVTPFRVAYGTSAQNPFILQGSSCQFSASFVTIAEMGKETLVSIIKDMLSNNTGENSSLFEVQNVDGSSVSVPLVEIVSLENRHTYNIDLNIENKEKIGVYASNDYRSDLVVAVGDHSLLSGGDARQLPPCGYFIVNKATPTVGLRDVTPLFALAEYGQADDTFLALDLIDIADFQYMTCIPDVAMGESLDTNLINIGASVASAFTGAGVDNGLYSWGNIFDGWRCFDVTYMTSPTGFNTLNELELGAVEGVSGLFKHNAREIFDILSSGTFSFDTNPEANNQPNLLHPNLAVNYVDAGIGTTTGNLIPLTASNLYAARAQELGFDIQSRNAQQISRWLGYLIPTEAAVTTSGFGAFTFTNVIGGRLIFTFENFVDELLNTTADIFDASSALELKNSPFSYYKYAFTMLDGEGVVGGSSEYNQSTLNQSSLTHSNITMGFASWLENSVVEGTFAGGAQVGFENFNMNLPLLKTGIIAHPAAFRDFLQSPDHAIFSEQKTIVDVTSFDAAVIPSYGQGGSNKSFKTKATHDFGIVFYDQRGRSSDVVSLGSHYVTGYDEASNQGPVRMQIDLAGAPPSWAWHYQIVYGGNSTYEDFMQYTSGGAFVEHEAEGDTGNIYVSLNYLQNSNISYSEAFGAVNEDGSKDLYTYREGDKLRIISYYLDNSSRVYPTSYEFDVVGVKNFADDEDNILINQQNPPAIPSKVGEFLVLRDNPQATGFSYSFVKEAQTGGTSPSSTSAHLWNNRCVFEIYTPLDSQAIENRVYYEISKKYNVIRDAATNSIAYENNSIVLDNGDVYFRRVAVNMPDFSSFNNKFLNILRDSGSSQSKFRDYYLETRTFTDTISGADQYDFGKVKIVNRFQKEIRRDSSVTFSDVQRLADPVLRYTSFDPTQGNFKDLPNKHGQISKIVDYGDALFVLNEDKISAIPIARSVISDLAGQDFVVASEKVMGTQKFYAGDSGCSTNPESVVKVGESLYFANKESQEVYKFNPANGVTVISEMGMKSYFRELFSSAISSALTSGQVRVVGGYDPILDEYVLSVYNATTLTFTSDVEIDQSVGEVVTDDPIAPSGTDGTTPVDGGDGEDDTSIQEYLDQIETLQEDNDTLGGIVETLSEAIVGVVGSGSVADPDGLSTSIQDFVDGLNNEILGLDDAIYTANTTINDLTTQLDDAVTAIDQNESVIIAQLIIASNAHAQLKANIEQAIAQMQDFRAQLIEGFDPDETLNVPSAANEFSSTYAPNTPLTAVEYDNFLQLYIDAANALVGQYIDAAGSYLKRDGSYFTDYTVGYGVFTDGSIPPDSAIGQNENFVSETNAFVAEMNGVTAASGVASIQDFIAQNLLFEQALEAEQGGSAELLQDKLDLLNQIGQLVSAINQTRGPSQGDDITGGTAVGAVTRLFGVNYNGVADNVIGELYDAYQTSLVALESKLDEYSTELENLVSANLEAGIQVYKDEQFETVIDSQLDNISSLNATRDALAIFAFQGLNALYNLAGQPDDFNILPEPLTSLFNDLGDPITSGEIISALDANEDGVVGFNEIALGLSIASEFESDLESAFSTTDALNALRGPVTTFLGDVNDVLDEFDLPISLDGVADLDENQFINLIGNFSQALGMTTYTGVGTGSPSLIDRIKNLKGALTEVAIEWVSRNGLQGLGESMTEAVLFSGETDEQVATRIGNALRAPEVGNNPAIIATLWNSVVLADYAIRQWQRWLGQVYQPLTPNNEGEYVSGFTSPLQEGSEGFKGLAPSDFLGGVQGVSLNLLGSNITAFGQGGSYLQGVVRAIEQLNAVAFGPQYETYTSNPAFADALSLPFTNFTVTNTLQDFVGSSLYQQAVGDIEAAYQAAIDAQAEEETLD